MIAALVLFTAAFANAAAENPQQEFHRDDLTLNAFRKSFAEVAAENPQQESHRDDVTPNTFRKSEYDASDEADNAKQSRTFSVGTADKQIEALRLYDFMKKTLWKITKENFHATLEKNRSLTKTLIRVRTAFTALRKASRQPVQPAHTYVMSVVPRLAPNVATFARTLTALMHFDWDRELSTAEYALGLQMYTYPVDAGIKSASDIAKIALMVKYGIAQSRTVSLIKLPVALDFIAGKVDPIVGNVFAAVNIGFDIYVIVHAENQLIRDNAIVGLVVKSASTALGVTALIAGAAGATTASAVLNAIATPVAGLGFGIIMLAGQYLELANKVSLVKAYFGKLKQGLTEGAYSLTNGLYAPDSVSVVENINFQTQIIALGSHYLAKTKFNPSGLHPGRSRISGERLNRIRRDNYQLWSNDVFNIRDRWEQKNKCAKCALRQHFATSDAAFFVLPGVPQAVITYEYFTLPGATRPDGDGFNALADLEDIEDFGFAYWATFEYIIHKVSMGYLQTNVTVVMDASDQTLLAQKIPEKNPRFGKLSYHIVGSANITKVYLQDGMTFILKSPKSSAGVNFILDSSLMLQPVLASKTTLNATTKQIQFRHVVIDYSAIPEASSVVLHNEGEITKLDIASNILLTTDIVAVSDVLSQLSEKSERNTTGHLNSDGQGGKWMISVPSFNAQKFWSVGAYFARLEEGFKEGPYQIVENAYVPNIYSVIKDINFQTNTIIMESPYLSKSDWYENTSKVTPKRFDEKTWQKDVFNIFEGWKKSLWYRNKPKLAQKLQKGNADPSVLILPSAPQSIITYEYKFLAGATSRGDRGFKQLRALEKKKDHAFIFDGWGYWTGEHLINSLQHIFLNTTVKLHMDKRHRVLVASKLEKQTAKSLTYHVVASAGLIEIILRDNLNFVLTSSDNEDTIAAFVLDSRFMPHDTTSVERNAIRIGNTYIDYRALPKKSRVWIRNTEKLMLLNLTTDEIVIANEIHQRVYSLEGVKGRLDELPRQSGTGQRFVSIRVKDVHKYTAYDTVERVLVYSEGDTPSDTQVLNVQSKEFGCFWSASQCRAWCTDLNTHNVLAQTNSLCNDKTKFRLAYHYFLGDEKRIAIALERTDREDHSLYYSYELSEHKLVLRSIRRFAPNNNDAEDVHFALDAAPETQNASIPIGNNGPLSIVPVKNSLWVSYDRIVRRENSSTTFVHRSWYSASLQKEIAFEQSKRFNLTALFFISLAAFDASENREEVNVLFHDMSNANLFRYNSESTQNDSLELIRSDVAMLMSAEAIGVTTTGCVIQVISSQEIIVLGYTLNFLLKQENTEDWWDSLDVKDKTLAPVVPFFFVEEQKIQRSNTWYLSETDLYVFVDDNFEHEILKCVGATSSKNEALLLTRDGRLWIVKAFRFKDIKVITSAGGLQLKHEAKPTPVEWHPSQSLEIIDAATAPDGMIIETKEGLMIWARRLTNTSAEFTLSGLRVSGQNAEDAGAETKKTFAKAKTLSLLMPTENFLPVQWNNETVGCLFNANSQEKAQVILPVDHRTILGVNDIENTLVFFNATRGVLWSGDKELPSVFFSLARFEETLIASSGSASVHIPKLHGVKVISLTLDDGVKTLIVPDEVTKVTVDTMDMNETCNVTVEVPWSEATVQEIQENEEIQAASKEPIGEDEFIGGLRKAPSGKILYWRKRAGQKMHIVSRSTRF